MDELEEEKKYFGTIVIIMFELYILHGIEVLTDEYGEDYYYKCTGNDDKLVYHSIIGGFIPLSGIISDVDYDRLIRLWNWNHEIKINI